MNTIEIFNEAIPIAYIASLAAVITTFSIYHLRTLKSIEDTHVPITSYPRSSWLSIIKDNREPTNLRVKLIYQLAYSPDATCAELEFIGFYLICERGIPRELLEDKRVMRAMSYSEKQLEIIRSTNNNSG
jgi:hypothetical protein